MSANVSITRQPRDIYASVLAIVSVALYFGTVERVVAQQQDDDDRPVVPTDPIDGILDAYKTHQIVALGEGRHGNLQGYELRLALLRDPRFQATVNDIVVEFGNAKYQDVMDRFVDGDRVDEKELRKAWLNTTQPNTVADKPIYENFYRAVREVNKSLPPQRKLRVLLGDPPIDWDLIKTNDDFSKQWREISGPSRMSRDSHAVGIIKREVLAKNRRALIVYGDMHFLRKNLYFAFADKALAEKKANEPVAESIVALLERDGKTKVYSIWTHSLGTGDLTTIQSDIESWRIPALVNIRDNSWGRAPFYFYYPVDGMRSRVTTADGSDEWAGLDPARPRLMQEQFDAILYVGPIKTLTYSTLSPALCADPEYIAMRSGRQALRTGRSQPDAEAALRRECERAGVK